MEDEENYRAMSDKIIREIAELNKELESIQNKCNHPEFKIELNKFTLLKKCTHCGLILGHPTEQERKNSGYI